MANELIEAIQLFREIGRNRNLNRANQDLARLVTEATVNRGNILERTPARPEDVNQPSTAPGLPPPGLTGGTFLRETPIEQSPTYQGALNKALSLSGGLIDSLLGSTVVKTDRNIITTNKRGQQVGQAIPIPGVVDDEAAAQARAAEAGNLTSILTDPSRSFFQDVEPTARPDARTALRQRLSQIDPEGFKVVQNYEKSEVGREDSLRDRYLSESKEFKTVRDSFSRIQASASDPSAAGDLALIFNYMKVLDPGSTVREGEFATAQNAAGVPERVIGLYNRIINGERLSDKTRNDFVDRAGRLFGRAERQQGQRTKQFSQLAERQGFNPENVVLDLSGPSVSESPVSRTETPTPPPAAPVTPNTPIAPPANPRNADEYLQKFGR